LGVVQIERRCTWSVICLSAMTVTISVYKDSTVPLRVGNAGSRVVAFLTLSHAESKDTRASPDAYSDNKTHYTLLIVERHIILDNTILMCDFKLLEIKILM
jgi:hypothetical protein